MKRVLLILIPLITLTACTKKSTKNIVDQVYKTEINGDFNSDERVKELTKSIKKIESEINDISEKYKQNGNFQRALALKMIHAKMYKQAYEHFTIAIDFYPQSDVLQYYKGLSAGLYAKEQDVDSIKNDYLGRAQRAYEHSIEINPSYIKALYALSILYIYELDRPNDGKELLDRLLAISSREFDAMLVRGLLFEKDGEYSAALDLYDKILKLSKKDSQILTADINRDRVLHRITGE